MTKLRFCANCGTELEENAVFCANCGTKIEYDELPAGSHEVVEETSPQETNDQVDQGVLSDAYHVNPEQHEEGVAHTLESVEEVGVKQAGYETLEEVGVQNEFVAPVHQQVDDVAHQVGVTEQIETVKEGLFAQKGKLYGVLGGAAVLVAGVFGWNHFSNEYSYDNAVVAFAQAYQSADDAALSQLLTTEKDKWTAERAKSFRESLAKENIDVVGKLKGLVEQRAKDSNVNGIYFDDVAKERILQVSAEDKFLGVIPMHKVVVDKIKVFAKNDYVDALEVIINGKTTKVEKNNQEVALGEIAFGTTEIVLKGKVDQKDFERKQSIDASTVKRNKYVVAVQSVKNSINASLPDSVKEHAKDVVYKVNGQDVKDLTGLAGDAVEMVAAFKIGDKTIETKPTKVTLSTDGSVSPVFELKPEDTEVVTKAIETAKQEEERVAKEKEAEKEAQRQFEAEKSDIEEFIRDYRDDIFRGITNRTTATFSSYYDSENNPVYQQYRSYVENDVPKLKIDSYVSTHFSVVDIRKEGDVYVVDTNSSFTVRYLDGGSKPTQKRQTYRLKKHGSSYAIISVTPL